MERRYQLVTFFDRTPELNEYVYQGSNGWYPQVALKRRFIFNGLTEEEGLAKVDEYIRQTAPFAISFGDRVKPAHMPVEVIEVVDNFITFMGESIISGHPDRENANFYPHMTVTWKGEDVVKTEDFAATRHMIQTVWVLKDDGNDGDSRAYRRYELAG
jgi:hypothetical protein